MGRGHDGLHAGIHDLVVSEAWWRTCVVHLSEGLLLVGICGTLTEIVGHSLRVHNVCGCEMSPSRPRSRSPTQRMPPEHSSWKQKHKWWDCEKDTTSGQKAAWSSATDSMLELFLSSRKDKKATLEENGIPRTGSQETEVT